jgi:transposase
MPSIAQAMRYRESLLKYADKHGIRKASRKYNEHLSYIYFWKARWEESSRSIESLRDKPKRPHSYPNEHSEEELTMIRNLRHRNPRIGLMDLWVKLQARGYARTPQGLYKTLKRLNMPTQTKSRASPSCKSKPYEQMQYPGQRIQIDVKHVPKECIDQKLLEDMPYARFFQYTAIDEYSRLRILEGYDERNTYNSGLFLKQAFSFYKSHGIEIKCVQIDNGAEFTKRLIAHDDGNLSSFELTAKHLNVKVKYIKPHTPRHNGKVERSHREDQKLFYSEVLHLNRPFKGLEDFKKRLKRHQNRTNKRPMRPLGFLSPLDYLMKNK